MTPSIQNIRPVFSGLLGAITQGNHQCSSSTASCLSGHRDLVLHKHFQRHGKTFANSPVAWYYNGPCMSYAHITTFTHIHTHRLGFSLFGSQFFLWGNCCFQTGSIKDETTFALISLRCRETYLQPVLLVTARIDMHRARCNVLAAKTTMFFSHASSLWTHRRTLASNHKTVWDMFS